MLFLRTYDLQKAGSLFKNEPKKAGTISVNTIPKKRKAEAPPAEIPITTIADLDRWRTTTKGMLIIASYKGSSAANDDFKFLSSEERRSAGHIAAIRQFDVLWVKGTVQAEYNAPFEEQEEEEGEEESNDEDA
ncbi:hypothetical protein MCOR27_002881 [Pyricularia oryzae]|nr:hypothetical protein MCOR27_002881 [Pyricularia oryzae]KAI6352482.1 hypothetical protein MCOR31_011871 [Pyricularia oryzae]KAI6387159.1 hypothetical protein MCOR24_011081 [Pyricularia oryzae]KAI6391674.1 hypothetical protein MCOR20_011312 [Pyricularia oryzae]KAI6444376.1 hypothetical protein MCOR15_010981 [Pyricularia oryzae]